MVGSSVGRSVCGVLEAKDGGGGAGLVSMAELRLTEVANLAHASSVSGHAEVGTRASAVARWVPASQARVWARRQDLRRLAERWNREGAGPRQRHHAGAWRREASGGAMLRLVGGER